MPELSALKNEELKKELKSRGLTTSGNKPQLISRLEEGLTRPNELNEDQIRIQSGEFDSDCEDDEDIGKIMARKMKKIKPDVEGGGVRFGSSWKQIGQLKTFLYTWG